MEVKEIMGILLYYFDKISALFSIVQCKWDARCFSRPPFLGFSHSYIDQILPTAALNEQPIKKTNQVYVRGSSGGTAILQVIKKLIEERLIERFDRSILYFSFVDFYEKNVCTQSSV